MASFSPVEAALTGFRIVREHPKALIGWIILQLVLSLSTTLSIVNFAGPALARLQVAGFQSLSSPTVADALVRQMAPALAITLPITLVIYPLFNAAMNRAVLRPQDDRFGYLRVGADEVRQLGLVVIFSIALFASELILITAASAAAAAFGAIGGAVGGGIGALVVLSAGVVGLAVVALRLSLVAPMTFATGKINFRESWKLTQGHGAAILGAFALALLAWLLVLVLGSFFIQKLMEAVAAGLGLQAAPSASDLSSLAHFLTPFELARMGLGAALNGLTVPLLLTPAATIYQSLARGASSAPIHETFA